MLSQHLSDESSFAQETQCSIFALSVFAPLKLFTMLNRSYPRLEKKLPSSFQVI